MFNPELRYFIAEENGEVEPIIDPKLFEGIIDYIGIICTAIILTLSSYNGVWLLNGILTPGQEWLELILILTSIGLFIVCKLIANFILNDLNESFNKLKIQIEEKDDEIKRLEKTIEQLTNTNDTSKKEIRELQNENDELNYTIDNLSDKNYDLLREVNLLKNNMVDEIRKDCEEFIDIEKRLKNIYDSKDILDDEMNQELCKTWNDEFQAEYASRVCV
jgi:hypothetical protein